MSAVVNGTITAALSFVFGANGRGGSPFGNVSPQPTKRRCVRGNSAIERN